MKALNPEQKPSAFLDLGRSYLEYLDIDYLCIRTFPDEPLTAIQAFKNVASGSTHPTYDPSEFKQSDDPTDRTVIDGEVIDPQERNEGFTNYVGWMEPIKAPIRPSDEKLSAVTEAAAVPASHEFLAVIASGSMYTCIKAGTDFLSGNFSESAPELIFLGAECSTAYHRQAMNRLKGRKFSVCAAEDTELAPEARAALNAVKETVSPENIYVFTNNPASSLAAEARKKGWHLFTDESTFTGHRAVLSCGALFPLAVCGVNIMEAAKGSDLAEMPDMESFIPVGCSGVGVSREQMMPLSTLNIKNLSGSKYLLKQDGYSKEITAYADPRLKGLAEWIRSAAMECAEGMDRIIYNEPLCLTESGKELIQLGNLRTQKKEFFVTYINIGKIAGLPDPEEITSADDLEILHNSIVIDTMRKQRRSGIPLLRIELPEASPFFFGEAVNLFSRAAAIDRIWNPENSKNRRKTK